MFAYRLAKDLGRTVAEILEMSNHEFIGWMAYYKMEAKEYKRQMEQARRKR